MITKQELEKLKELAGKFLDAVMKVYDVNNHAIIEEAEKRYNYAANPATVLRLIEALDVAIKSLIKIRVNCSCTELCMCSEDDVYIAQEALDKIYGVE